MPLPGFLQEFQRGLRAARLRHSALEHLAFVINGAPEMVPLTIDLHEDFFEVPPPVARPHALDAALSDFRGKHLPYRCHKNRTVS